MNLQLIDENDELLKQKTLPWDFANDTDIELLIENMTNIMIANNGIGLAANQVGVNKSIFLMKDEENIIVCVNPKIITGKEDVRDMEGCLSFKNLYLYVNRYKEIEVEYQNIFGKIVNIHYTDLLARVFQHELDHLNGIRFIDRVKSLSLELAKKKRKKLNTLRQ